MDGMSRDRGRGEAALRRGEYGENEEQKGVTTIGEGGGSLRNLEQARRECQDRERWKLFCHGHPLVGAPRSRRQNE